MASETWWRVVKGPKYAEIYPLEVDRETPCFVWREGRRYAKDTQDQLIVRGRKDALNGAEAHLRARAQHYQEVADGLDRQISDFWEREDAVVAALAEVSDAGGSLRKRNAGINFSRAVVCGFLNGPLADPFLNHEWVITEAGKAYLETND